VTPGRVTVHLRVRQPSGVDPPIARTATIRLDGDFAYHGDRAGGATIGTGAAIGVADTARTRAEITILGGGPGTVLLRTIVRHPVAVRQTVKGTVAADGDGTKIDLMLPPHLQEIGGVPVGLQRLDLAFRRGAAITIGSCPSAGRTWRYAAAVAFTDGTVARHTGAVACRGTA
jgi:hypothetical protein